MAIYHNSFQIIKRSAGRSTVAVAAYRAGEELTDHTTGLTHDFTNKGRDHVLWNEIILPQNAPEEWCDRETLWNAVENAERGKSAQLAREFNAALPCECTKEQWVEIAHAYGQWFADQGMCVDLAIHDPDKDIPNPHIHGMLTMRPIDRNGYFSKSKTRTVYRLDENGEKIPVPVPGTMLTAVRDLNGRWFAVPDFKYGGIQKIGKHGRKEYYREKIRVNDWDTKEFLFAARREWAEICNRYLSPEQQIDHRSLKEQGIDRTPTVHDGVAARAIDEKIKATGQNPLIRVIQENLPVRELSRRHGYISRYTIEGRRRTEIEMLLIAILSLIGMLLHLLETFETSPGGFYGPEVNDRRKRLERLKTSTENELDTLREYGVTRCMENRIETYAARTEQEIRSMIRLKERELALVNNEIWHAHDKGLGKDTIAWFLDARSRLYGELRALRTEKKDLETRDQNRESQPQAPKPKPEVKQVNREATPQLPPPFLVPPEFIFGPGMDR